MTDTACAETPVRDHVARFWRYLETGTVRIQLDLKHTVGAEAPDGPVVYWDCSTYSDDTAKALLQERAALTARAEKAEAERDDAMTAIARVREALTYYADPLAWMQARGVTDKHIPDFYSELCFGEMAQDALSTFQQTANVKGTRP